MILDVGSVLAVAALVVNLAGAVFILETLLRRDEGAGRIWALAYLSAMLMTLSYVLWIQTRDSWWAIAVGNGAIVASSGFMWLGCRLFNGRRMSEASLGVAAAVVVSTGAVLVEGSAGGDWAGAEWMFIALVLLAGAAGIECLRGALLASRTAWVLAFALGAYALYYVSRTTAFLTSGPDSSLFQSGFGTIPTTFVTVAYTIIAVITTSVLLASRAPMRGDPRAAGTGESADGIVDEARFASELAALCSRAERRSESVGVISVRIDDLDQVSTAFGSEVARSVSDTWRHGVRRHAPSNAFVGEDGPNGLVVGVLVASAADARRQAAVIYRGLFDDLGDVTSGVIPVVGVGVGLSDAAGYDSAELTRVAREAASRAALSVERSVLFGDDE